MAGAPPRIESTRASMLVVGLPNRDLLTLRALLQRLGNFALQVAPSAAAAQTMVSRQVFDVVLYDLSGSEGDGLDFVVGLHQSGYRGAVIVIGESGGKQTAAAVLSAGAHEYLPKDANMWGSLPSLLVRALRFGRLARRVAELENTVAMLRQRVEQEGRLEEVTGAFKGGYLAELYDREMRRLRRYGGYMAVVDATVYNYRTVLESHGEGAAKEVVKGFAAIAKRTLRSTDFIGYLEEGHFSLLLPSTDVTGVKALTTRIERAVEEANERMPNRPDIRVSFHLRAAGGYDDLTKKA